LGKRKDRGPLLNNRIMGDEFNTWGKVWTYLIVALMSSGIFAAMWGLNVYTHWEPNIQQNVKRYTETNDCNIARLDNIYRYTKAFQTTKDSVYIDSIYTTSRFHCKLTTVAEQKALDSIAALDSIPPVIVDTVPPVITPESIIISVETNGHQSNLMRVRVTNSEVCQAVARYGKVSGIYTGAGIKEYSFKFDKHNLTIGNIEPLEPNTLYYVQAEVTDQDGNTYLSDEVTGRTTQ
jgi:hypothetical protein